MMNEINDLHIDGLPRVDKLNALVGKYVNLEYQLPNGQKVKFLDDQKTYLGNQMESEFGGDRCLVFWQTWIYHQYVHMKRW